MINGANKFMALCNSERVYGNIENWTFFNAKVRKYSMSQKYLFEQLLLFHDLKFQNSKFISTERWFSNIMHFTSNRTFCSNVS